LEELAPRSGSGGGGVLAVATAGNVGGLVACGSDIFVRNVTLDLDFDCLKFRFDFVYDFGTNVHSSTVMV